MKFILVSSLIALASVNCEFITSKVSSSANCKNVETVAVMLKNDSIINTCSQILTGAGFTSNGCSELPSPSSYGSIGCSDLDPLEYATMSFPMNVEFVGLMTYTVTDTTCSLPQAGTFLVPDGTCKTPFWPGDFDINPTKSYKVTIDDSQNINLKAYDDVNCNGTLSENTIPNFFIDYCNNLTGTYILVVTGTGTASNATETTTTQTPTTTGTPTPTATISSDSTKLQVSPILIIPIILVSLFY